MPYGKLESTFHNDPKFRLLSEALGLPRELGAERGAALARGFVSSIWSWATDHAPDGHLPDACRTTDVERIAGWPTARGRLYSALVAVGFIDETPTDRGTDRVLHRFWERAETHKAAQRQRKRRETERAVTLQSQITPPPPAVTVTPIREERSEERERRGDDGRSLSLGDGIPSRSGVPVRAPIPPPTDDLGTITASQIPASAAIELWNVHQRETTARKLAAVLAPVGQDLHHCKKILAMCGGHKILAARVVEAFVRHDGNEFWTQRKWALWVLVEERNFQDAVTLARMAGFRDASQSLVMKSVKPDDKT